MKAAEYKRPRVFICESLSSLFCAPLLPSLSISLALSVDVRVRKSLSGVQQRRLNNSTHVAHIFCCRPPSLSGPSSRPRSCKLKRRPSESRWVEGKLTFSLSLPWKKWLPSGSLDRTLRLRRRLLPFFRVHKSCLWDIILNLVAISSAHCGAISANAFCCANSVALPYTHAFPAD